MLREPAGLNCASMTARPKFRDIATDPILALMLALGFSSGLPFLLVLGTQAARLAEAKVPIEEIGLVSWVGLCYSLKFLWSPVIDTVDVPVLARLLGRRRAWLLTAQIGIALGLIALAFADPAHSLLGSHPVRGFHGLFRRHAGYRHRRLAHRFGAHRAPRHHGRDL